MGGIKSKERVKKYGEVFTPEWVVKEMCDYCEEGDKKISDIDTTVLEPACGTGNFLIEILDRKLKNCKDKMDVIKTLQSIYGVDILADNVVESRKRMFELVVKVVLEQNIIEGDFLKVCLDLDKYFNNWGRKDEMDR